MIGGRPSSATTAPRSIPAPVRTLPNVYRPTQTNLLELRSDLIVAQIGQLTNPGLE